MAGMTTHYFPDADEPALQPFTKAFIRLMFAHAVFEHRASDLYGSDHRRYRVPRTAKEPVVGGQATQAHEEAHQ